MTPTLASTLRAVADAIAAGAPTPTNIDLHVETGRAVTLQLASNNVDGLDVWADVFGAVTRVEALQHPGQRAAWRVHRTAGYLAGAEVEVWSAIDVKE